MWKRTEALISSRNIRKASVISTEDEESWFTRKGLAKPPRPALPKQNGTDRVIDLKLSGELLSTMSKAADTVLQDGMLVWHESHGPREKRGGRPVSKDPAHIESRNKILQERHNEDKLKPDRKSMKNIRESLPMNQFRSEVLSLVNENPYSIIVGATGSGKTTQVPQIILEDAIERGEGANVNIMCTQPRRIAATSVARRVASERNEALGDTVGYFIRFDSKLPQAHGSVTYCTIGALLRRLQGDPKDLETVSHIIVDEVHERSIQNDVLLVILKRYIDAQAKAGKKVPRVVISAYTIIFILILFQSEFSALISTP